MARRRRGAPLVAALALVGLLAAGVGGVVWWLTATRTPPVPARCAAELDGTSWYLDPEQADNAATIAAIGVTRGLPARAVTIALATALQESDLRNLDYGDRDSLGLFQQRPSQGWGTPEQVQDPVYAAGAFYDALVEVDGYQDLPITQAAQAVQRSAFPDAYAQHETRARAWASALTGWSPGAVTCTLPPDAGPQAAQGADPTAAVVARAARDLGLVVAPGADGSVLLDAATLAGGAAEPDRLAWALAHWAVASASATGGAEVVVADRTWSRESGVWQPGEAAAAPGSVSVRPRT